MIKKYLFLTFFTFYFLNIISQEKKKGIFNIQKIGLLYNYADENNFLFDDPDYSYTTKTIKAQVFYRLGRWKNFDVELIIQPQIQTIKHQLLNLHFVLPSEENYQIKRKEFTTPKTMNLYGLELGFVLKKEIINKLDIQITAGLGVASIDTRTERLAKGFTFLENGSLGFSYKLNKSSIYLGSNIGHVSNLDFKSPNNGYTFFGIEIGYTYSIQ